MMENEVLTSQPPIPQPNMEQQEMVPPAYPDVEAMKAKARELAIQQFLVSKGMPAQPRSSWLPLRVRCHNRHHLRLFICAET